jgi:fluoride exporter
LQPEERRAAEPAIDVRLHPGVLACIVVGGALGSLARYGVGRVVHVPADGFPRATFLINVSGAFALGCFLAVVNEREWPARYVRPLFAVGFCGAFTTFSTMAVETATLVKDHHAGLGVGYLLASIALGLITCTLGVRLGRLVARSSAIRRA